MNDTPKHKYPEHEKLQKISVISQEQGQFLDWLISEKGLLLTDHDDRRIPGSMQNWLAEYHEIDQDALEKEKRTMLAELRKAFTSEKLVETFPSKDEEEPTAEEFKPLDAGTLIDMARNKYAVDGEIEIDRQSLDADLELELSRADNGAYVRAWVWVEYPYNEDEE